MTSDNYTPTAALTGYYQSRSTNRPARHWATEKLIHDMAALGVLTFFEGPGPNPMALTGASTDKIWLDCELGVTSTSGTFKRYKGTGLASDEANWEALTPAGYLLHLGNFTPQTSTVEYATRTAAIAATIDGGVTHIRTAGYTTVGDGGEGLYLRAISEPTHEAKIQSADGAWWELADLVVNIKQLGAAVDGTTDDTDAINNAIGVGRPVYVPAGNVKITDQITIPANEILYGSGPSSTIFVVEDDFNLSATSVFDLANSSVCRDFGIVFDQSAAAVSGLRADLIAYPWAFDISTAARCMLERIRLNRAYNGIDGTGNCGGCFLNALEIGAFNIGLDIDGALDTVHINQLHVWCFDFAGVANLLAIYSDGNTVGVDIGACDDIEWNGGLLFRAKLNLTGGCFGNINALAMDSSYSNIVVTGASEIVFSGGYSTKNAGDDYHINCTGAAELTFSGFDFENSTASSVPLIRLNNASAELRIIGGHITVSGTTTELAEITDGRFFLDHSYINAGTAVRADALIDVNGGVVCVTGNRFQDMGGSPSEFINIAADGLHLVKDNVAPNWSMVAPTATAANGVYGPNQCVTRVSNQSVVGAHKISQISGTLDGSGNVTIAHGITGLQTKLLAAYAHRISATRFPISQFIFSVDGTNVVITTSTAAWSGQTVEVTLIHT